MRWPVLLIVSLTAMAIAIAGRAIEWDSTSSMPVPARPNWYHPQPQTFTSAWGGKLGVHSLQESNPVEIKLFERIKNVSSKLAVDPDQGDFSFFKENSDGSWHSAVNVGGKWNEHPWSFLTKEQIQEMKSRLDLYLLSVNQFGSADGTWLDIPMGLKCNLIPLAFAPSLGSLLCLEPESDLLFVVANNNDQIDVGTFNYCSSASDRIIVFPTNTRLQSVLDFGASNDQNVQDDARTLSISYIERLIDSAGSGTTIVHASKESPFWKHLRYTDIVGGSALTLLIAYALVRTLERVRPSRRVNSVVSQNPTCRDHSSPNS